MNGKSPASVSLIVTKTSEGAGILAVLTLARAVRESIDSGIELALFVVLLVVLFVPVVLALLLVVALWRWKYEKKPLLDYKALFYAGLIWLAIGLPSGITEIRVFGLLFILLRLAKRGEWKKEKKR